MNPSNIIIPPVTNNNRDLSNNRHILNNRDLLNNRRILNNRDLLNNRDILNNRNLSNNIILDISTSLSNKYSDYNVPNNKNLTNNYLQLCKEHVYRNYLDLSTTNLSTTNLSTKNLTRTDEIGNLGKMNNIIIPARRYSISRRGSYISTGMGSMNERRGGMDCFSGSSNNFLSIKPLFNENMNTPLRMGTYTGTGAGARMEIDGFRSLYESREVNISNLKKEFIKIDMEINTLSDMIKMIDLYPVMDHIEYNIDMESLNKIRLELVTLNNMIGIENLKNSILDQIIYYMQNFHKVNGGENDYMHTVIYGPPGTGKTEIARLMGKIFSKLGMLKSGTFKKVTRSDLIAGYLGQTALKTENVIKQTLGGVLFIDEAYALGNSEKKDSFAKECIDTLCEALSNYKDSIMVIIAGYENELKECFFNYNQGLESRFSWRFKTEEFSPKELLLIFKKKIYDAKWSLIVEKALTDEWFEERKDNFKSYGRDIETLFAKTKISHSRRIFGKNEEDKTKLTLCDINKGYELYLVNVFQDKEKGKDDSKILGGDIKNWYI